MAAANCMHIMCGFLVAAFLGGCMDEIERQLRNLNRHVDRLCRREVKRRSARLQRKELRQLIVEVDEMIRYFEERRDT